MNDQAFYYEIHQEPRWHRWVDALVVLFIGVACGIVFSQGMIFYDVQTTTTTETFRATEKPEQKINPDTGKVVAPQKPLQFEEV